MAQHDYNIANATGASVRSDLNNVLSAIVSVNSGAAAPGTTFAYQIWADTTAGLLKQRNAANAGWLVRGSLTESFVVSRSSNTILAAADFGKPFVATSGFTQTLTAAATLGDGWMCFYRVNSGATVTFDPNGSENIDGATTKVVVGPSSGVIFCSGSAFFTYGFDRPADTKPTRQVFTSGSGTYTTPAGCTHINIRMVGAGGGGGGNGTSGQSGGGAGGSTTFSTFTAGGGGAGGPSGANSAGASGAASGSPNISFAGGQGGLGSNTAGVGTGAHGGGSVFCGGGPGGQNGGAGTPGRTNTGEGGGGAGGSSGVPSASGGGGGAYVEHRITSPAASYSYGVGAAGTAGGAGTSGAAGGAGGSGVIIVDEFYD